MVNGPKWVHALNEYFGYQNILELNVDDLPGPDVSLSEALGQIGVGQMDDEEMTLTSMPASHVAALGGVVRDAVARNVPVTFAWMPGYEHEITISEWQHDGSPCGITVVLRGPHRADIAARAG